MNRKNNLYEIALLFLKLGTIGFGGPPSNIALMEQETVHKRKWVEQEHFLDMLAATNLIPGPNASEMALHLGYARAGLPGLLTAGLFYIFPSFFLSLLMGVLYAKYGSIPQVEAIFYAINPLLISIIISSAYRLGKGSIKNWKAMIVFVGFLAAALLGLNETLVILLSGVVWILLNLRPSQKHKLMVLFFMPILPGGVLVAATNPSNSLLKLFLYFLKTGAVLFGSGLALLALIQNDVVNNFHWLTQHQLVDAITVGQITPGPVSSAATFIGYQVAGYGGAVIATIGIFIPSFFIVFLTSKWLTNIKKGGILHYFLQGVTIGVIALILVVAVRIFQTAIIDILTLGIAVVGLFLLWKYEVETIWLILAGVIISLVKFYLF
ncbi:MAG: chromate efflux transporter [Chloroflexi bacterium]|nr:chromate efflux transporter [Chloroflexota bacterium]